MNEAEIIAVIKECKQGNTEAYTKIIHHFQARVFHICFHFTGTSQDAEDAAADVFVKIYHVLPSFNPQYKFSTWLFKITVNHCIGIFRKKKRERNYLLSQFPDRGAEEHDEETPCSLFFKELEQERVREALRSIPAKYQAALMLKYYRDLSYREISEILSVPQNTAASLILRGKKELRKKLRDLKTSEVSHERQKQR
jgi:RNA polymerase sigma-70 factor (ECF subfamily)